MGRRTHPDVRDWSGTFPEVRNGSRDSTEVRDGLGDPPGDLGRVLEYSGWFEMGRGTI